MQFAVFHPETVALRRRFRCLHFLYLRSQKLPGRLSLDREASHRLCWQTHHSSVFAKQAMWDRVHGAAIWDDVCGSTRRCSCRRFSTLTYGNADVSQAFLLCGRAWSQNFSLLAFDNSWKRSHWPRGVFGRTFKWLELAAWVKEQKIVLCKKTVVEKNLIMQEVTFIYQLYRWYKNQELWEMYL